MTLRSQSQDLFDYIAEVYSVDLPVTRDVLRYGAERWWQADVIQSRFCRIRQFGSADEESGHEAATSHAEPWLSVHKSACDPPPSLPAVLNEWIEVSLDPSTKPVAKRSLTKRVTFESNEERRREYQSFLEAWNTWTETGGDQPQIPTQCIDWIDNTGATESAPVPVAAREVRLDFNDDPQRPLLFEEYLSTQWALWAERVLPQYRANQIYDALYMLHQRLSVQGDRWELLWGHLLLSWQHSSGGTICHPVVMTPLSLQFHPDKRELSLNPVEFSRCDLECLRDLEYGNKEILIDFIRKLGEPPSQVDPWNHNQMKGLAATITGYLSTGAAIETNLYDEVASSKPSVTQTPTMCNCPVIFVRERVRQFWIEDARKVSAAIAAGAEIPAFVRAAVGETISDNNITSTFRRLNNTAEPDPNGGVDTRSDEQDELYFPLEWNSQQKEIWERLGRQFGVLVQGPPGTGKSHTIANVISAVLASGGKVLVTSQTENALKVLRALIPKEIQSLCVSQLGNDTESKKQLGEAVTAIGQHLAEKNSHEPIKRVRHLTQELERVRRLQSSLRVDIRNWAKLDAEIFTLDGVSFTAQEAAKYCAERQTEFAWWQDQINFSTDPPLTDEELLQVCSVLREVKAQDIASCNHLLVDPQSLISPDDFRKLVADLRTANTLFSEAQDVHSDWGQSLMLLDEHELMPTVAVLESAIRGLSQFNEWQQQILDLIALDSNQAQFWREFVAACTLLKGKAFNCFNRIQGFQLDGLSQLNSDEEWLDVLDELAAAIEKRLDLGGLLARFRLTKKAKFLYDTVHVDNKKIRLVEQVEVVKAALNYERHLEKFIIRWDQAITPVKGPRWTRDSALPLAEADSKLKAVRHIIEWAEAHLSKISVTLVSHGCPEHRRKFHDINHLNDHLTCYEAQLASLRSRSLNQQLKQHADQLSAHSASPKCHPLLGALSKAFAERDFDKYEEVHQELLRLHQLAPIINNMQVMLGRLRAVAPSWSEYIAREAPEYGLKVIQPSWRDAWLWSRLNDWLTTLHKRESVESLQLRLEKARTEERELLTRLIVERTWSQQVQRIKAPHYMALTTWAFSMAKYGKGTGPKAQYWLASAAVAMKEAVKAVPAWIMPLFRVVQSFPVEADLFDLVIIDEASQCDIRALPVLYRAKQVIIVGDPEQISPSNVGVPTDKVHELIRQRLSSIPNPTRFHIDNSLFGITQTIPGITRVMLTEHFRCVPSIIEFNNNLCPSYAGNLEPLRQPKPDEQLAPPIVTHFVKDGFKNNNDVNKPEAEALVEALILCCGCEKYRNKSIGVISLLGEAQAKYISDLIAKELDEREREQRRIICGDAYAFQGDERDVMFLSLVVAGNAQFAGLVKDDARQRFNVATSRARDQVFLFHSILPEDIKSEQCVRYKLLKWYLNPPVAELEADLETLRHRADSPFEIEVGERILKRGFKLIPQHRPFPRDFQYRIDLLVQGPKGRVAVECDGDRWHGPEKWEADQRREAQLRRAGLRFWRVSGSSFYRNKEKALDELWPVLEKYCC